MIVLHIGWIPESSNAFDGNFFFWGEATEGDHRRSFPGPSRKNPPKKHPWQASTSVLSNGLNKWANQVSIPTEGSHFEEGSQVLYLPSNHQYPYPSYQWIVEDMDVLLSESDSDIKPWEIWGVKCLPNAGLKLLQTELERVRKWFHPGPEIKYINMAVKFANKLLARQRFIPSIYRNQNDQLEARWQPLYSVKEDQERFQKLAESMPASIFSTKLNHDSPFDNANCNEMLRGLLQSWIDLTVRKVLVKKNWNRNLNGQSVGAKWLNKLGAQSAKLDLSTKEDTRLVDSYDNWIRGFDKFTEEKGLRTGFKLIPPQSEEQNLFQSQSDWRLEFFLETTEQETFHIPAGELWSQKEDELKPLVKRYRSPKQILIQDLGLASNLFPPINKSLDEKKPIACVLTSEEAYRYLKTGYWLLKEGGFLTSIPSWWNPDKATTNSQLGLKAKISPTPSENIGQGKKVGWDALLNFKWQLAMKDQSLNESQFEKLKDLKIPLVKICGNWVELDPNTVTKTLKLLEEEPEEISLKETLSQKLLGAAKDCPLPVTEIETEGWIKRLLSGTPKQEASVQLPQNFKGKLWTHQEKGLGWLFSLTRWGLSPCLADDMGLGKTIQFLALILKYKEIKELKKPSLLVCPTSVLGNWCRETERFAPSISYHLHHGPDRPGEGEFKEEIMEKDLVITSYGLLRRDYPLLSKVPWQLIALDEAQKIKNPGTKTARAARNLPSQVRMALTGTPIENNLMDLWSIMEFLNPGYLGPRNRFRKEFARPIQKKKATEKEQVLKKLINPLILRRKKTDKDILPDLPKKVEKKEYCSLTGEQGSLYQAVVEEAGEKLNSAEAMKKRGLILSTINKLKQICNHPSHFLGDHKFGPQRSGKIIRLIDILETLLEEGYCSLIFTQYVEFGQMLKKFMQERYHFEVPFLHGGTTQSKRDQLIDRFQEQKDRLPFFLLSLRAGGLGVNLTQASHVIHVDRWWNPAVETQATDRAHRIGQQQKVCVHKFVTSGTYEESIDQLIESKKDLAQRIIASGESGLTELSKEEFLDLIKLKEEVV